MTSSPSETLKQSLGELLGLARGLLADQELSDDEINFLNEWLEERYQMTASFPGNVIHKRIKEVLEDGVITEEERSHLVETLTLLVEDRLEDLAEQVDLTELVRRAGPYRFQQDALLPDRQFRLRAQGGL